MSIKLFGACWFFLNRKETILSRIYMSKKLPWNTRLFYSSEILCKKKDKLLLLLLHTLKVRLYVTLISKLFVSQMLLNQSLKKKVEIINLSQNMLNTANPKQKSITNNIKKNLRNSAYKEQGLLD